MLREFAVSSLAVLFALFLGGLIILGLGHNPISLYGRLFQDVAFNPYGFSQVLFKATTLIFTGLAASFSFRSGLFNIGAEGQLYMGAFLCAWVGFTWTALPGFFLLPLCIAGAFLGGALWAVIPGYLKARTGAHEVITTMMMNFMALALTNYLISALYHIPETVHTPEVSVHATLPRLSFWFSFFGGSSVNASLILALLAVAFFYYFLLRTPLGFEFRAMGTNVHAARYGGIPIEKRWLESLMVSGGIAGLGGINYILGYKYYFEQGFATGQGFMGIAVALLARNHPLGIVLAALLFGFLSQGALVINLWVPKEILEIVQALIIFSVVIGRNVIR